MEKRETILDRFLKYVKIDTQADSDSEKHPSTGGQLELAKIVQKDFEDAGVKNIELTEDGFLFGTIPSNVPENHPNFGKVPTIGYLAHFDTALEISGKNVNPQIIENYECQKIALPNNKDEVLDPAQIPALKKCQGHTIITADGTTLLGADNKAGIAEIVELAYYLRENPDIVHGDLRLAIIPDEEIGVGAHRLNIKQFGAHFAYTVDGGSLGQIDIETFNGFQGKIKVKGHAAFPGYGKGVYVNAIQILAEFISDMSPKLWPQCAQDRQGIWWVDKIKGETAQAEVNIFLRDFEISGIESMKRMLSDLREILLKKYPEAKIEIDIKETYRNYKDYLIKEPRVVEYAKQAVQQAGLKPLSNSVRGGNDACGLCQKGLISTNLFAGAHQMHSYKEWTSLEVMQKAVETIANLAQVWVQKNI